MLLYGCVSTKKVRNQSLEVVKFDTAKFNGNYANKADTAKHLNSYKLLFEQLFSGTFIDRYPKNIHITDSTIVNFYFDNKKTLVITTTENGKVLHNLKLKGKIKGNYFSANRKLFLIPIPMFFYFHDETKILLGNDANGNLVLKSGKYSIGWILMAANNWDISQSLYKKLK